jgi:hypothetical protein
MQSIAWIAQSVDENYDSITSHLVGRPPQQEKAAAALPWGTAPPLSHHLGWQQFEMLIYTLQHCCRVLLLDLPLNLMMHIL